MKKHVSIIVIVLVVIVASAFYALMPKSESNSKTTTLNQPENTQIASVDHSMNGYFSWLSNYGKTSETGEIEGDFNNDGYVDGIDYVIWLNSFI